MNNSKLISRINGEIKIIKKDPLNYATAYPDENNIKIWYVLFVGQKDTDYSGGHYICKITLSDDYPFSPPKLLFLTPNGRFEINMYICLTITHFHPEHWQATITIKTMLIQIFTMFSIEGSPSHIGHLAPPTFGTSSNERMAYAENSIKYNIENHKDIYEKFDFTHLNTGNN